MKALSKILLASGMIVLAAQANAITIFSDDFNLENGGVANSTTLNYVGFANWTVTAGSVDLIGNGYFDLHPGNGLYVDLDGSTGVAGTMAKSSAISVNPGYYSLSFMLGGNKRNAPNDTVNVWVNTGLASQSYSLASADPLTTYSLPFQVNSATTINLVFQNLGGDNQGAILDNVVLEMREPGQTVPDGGMSLMLLGIGLGGLGMLRKQIR